MVASLKNKGVPYMKLMGLVCSSDLPSWGEINSDSKLSGMIDGARVSIDKAFEFVDAAYNYLNSKGNGVVRPSKKQINSLVAKYQSRKRFSAKKVSDVKDTVLEERVYEEPVVVIDDYVKPEKTKKSGYQIS